MIGALSAHATPFSHAHARYFVDPLKLSSAGETGYRKLRAGALDAIQP